MGYIVTENREYDKRTVLFNEDNTITWKNSANKATKFDSIVEAEKAIEKYFGEEEDYGIAIFKVIDVTGKDGVKRSIYSTGGKVDRKQYKEIKSEDISDAFIRDYLGENEADIFKYSDLYLHDNREEIKKTILERIGQLIDLHNQFEDKFASSFLYDNQKIVAQHSECLICDRIKDYSELLEKQSLSKFYGYLIGEEQDRFKDFIKNRKNKNNEKYDEDEYLKELSYLMKDFVALRKNGYTLKEIANFWGIGINTLYRYYDNLANSKYCFTIGKLNRSGPRDNRYYRAKIDHFFE